MCIPTLRRSEEHTSELQSLSLHDALPIYSGHRSDRFNCRRRRRYGGRSQRVDCSAGDDRCAYPPYGDRKSTRLNSSHFPYTTLFRSIQAIAPTASIAAAAGDTGVDLSGLTVLPGMIDVHTHLTEIGRAHV